MKKILLGLLVILLGFSFNCSWLHGYRGLVDARLLAPSSFHCPPRTIRVALSPSLPSRERELALGALPELESLGVHPVVVTGNPDVWVYPWNHNCQDRVMGLYTTGANYIEVAKSCTSSESQYQAVIVHEIGHWLGMRHVCLPDRRTTDVCSPVGVGTALMNPYVGVTHSMSPVELDLSEYDRVCWLRQTGH